MEDKIIKTFTLEEDTVEVLFCYDPSCGKYLGNYPDFEINPRHTNKGHPWVDVTMVGCPYSDSEGKDCGSCGYMIKVNQKDIIGICVYENKQLNMPERRTV